MKRNKVTTANKLQIGDRFFKKADKGKKVFEMVEYPQKVTNFQTYTYWCAEGGVKPIEAIKADTVVVFLRSTK